MSGRHRPGRGPGPATPTCWCCTCPSAAWPSPSCSRWSRRRCRPSAATCDASTGDISWVITAYLLSASVLTPDPRPPRRHGRQAPGAHRRAGRCSPPAPLLAALAPNLAVLIVGPRAAGRGRRDPAAVDRHRPRRAAAREGRRHRRPAVGDLRRRRRRRHRGRRPDRGAPVLALAVLAAAGARRRRPARRDLRDEGVAGPHARAASTSLGAGILSVALVSLLLAISKGQAWGWGEAKTVGLLALGVVALVVFVLVELRVKEPLDRHAADADPRRVGHRPGRADPRLRHVRHVPAGPDAAAAARRDRLRLRQVGVAGRPVPAADRR